MLKSLSVHGLRGFATKQKFFPAYPDGTPGSGLTIITGPNNSGKSTLVEAISARKPTHVKPSFNVGMRNRIGDMVTIEYEFDHHNETITSTRKGSSETETTGVQFDEGKIYLVPSRRYFQPHFSKMSGSDRSSFRSNYFSQTEFRSQQMIYFEGRLFKIEQDQENFNLIIKELIPDLLEWSIDQNENGQFFLKFQSEDRSHSSAGVGDGIISAIVVATALYDSLPGETIVIDEPELSLHPQVQKRLFNLLERYASDRQIIISTHSPYMIGKRALENGARVYRCWDRNDGIQLYSADIFSDSGLATLLTDDKNKPHLFGLDAREIFFTDDQIIVVEGQEDVVFWPIAFGQEMADKYSLFGWGAGGASNVGAVLKLLRALGFKKVVAAFDNDVQDKVASARNEFPDFLVVEIPAADIRTKKPVSARPEKLGLLDNSNKRVRPEFLSLVTELTSKIDDFMTAN